MTTVPLTEADDRFTPAMAGLEVDRCSFDHQATLVVGVSEGPYHVVLEGPLVLTTAGGAELVLDPETGGESVAPPLGLLHRRVERADAFKDGRLELDFRGGARLSVPVSPDYEAWSIVGPNGLRLVSLPGGELAVWRPEQADRVLAPQLWPEPVWRDVDAALSGLSVAEQRSSALAVAGLAVARTGAAGDAVRAALTGGPVDEDALDALERRYDAQGHDELAFRRARAVAAVRRATGGDAGEALREAMYEARHALDDDPALIEAATGDLGLRARMEALWVRVDREAHERRDPFAALEAIADLYERLGPDERRRAGEVLAGWLGSPDEARRFDALALIRRLRIVAAVPALRALSAELARSDRPGAPFERDKVDALADELAGR